MGIGVDLTNIWGCQTKILGQRVVITDETIVVSAADQHLAETFRVLMLQVGLQILRSEVSLNTSRAT